MKLGCRFTNPPCIREIVRAMVRKKPLIALLEPDKTDQRGGYSEAECRRILLSSEYADKLQSIMGRQVAEWAAVWGRPELRLPTGTEIVEALFERHPPLVWYRLADLQDVSMRLIAEQLLLHSDRRVQAAAESCAGGKKSLFMSRASAGGPTAHTTAKAAPRGQEYEQLTYMKGEIMTTIKGSLTLPAVRDDCQFHLYISPNSPDSGAKDFAIALEQILQPSTSQGGLVSADSAKLTWTDDPRHLAACEHMVILLTSETWTHENADAFAHEVCEAMRSPSEEMRSPRGLRGEAAGRTSLVGARGRGCTSE